MKDSYNMNHCFQLFRFCSQIKLYAIRVEINKKLVRIANREDPDQTASSEAV